MQKCYCEDDTILSSTVNWFDTKSWDELCHKGTKFFHMSMYGCCFVQKQLRCENLIYESLSIDLI